MPFPYETVRLDPQRRALVILDQTRLPNEAVTLVLSEIEEIRDAIYRLAVRGAPAIGVAAGFGVYLAALRIDTDSYNRFLEAFRQAKTYLNAARPTAVNLSWALERMERVVLQSRGQSVDAIKERLKCEALAIQEEDVRMCRGIGEHGLALLHDGDGILTHCNAGRLATAGCGTALAPLYLAHERGLRLRVFADETRPLLQGARLTAFELTAAGLDTTLICDNVASQVMKNGWVNAVFVGCDRVAANGDACNKIGTSGLAVLAHHYGIPFYVLGPTSTLDLSLQSGRDIPIEQRPSREVTELWYAKRMAPEGVKVYNPAFDVTDHTLISGIVTERGIARAPYADSLRVLAAAGANPQA